MVLAKQITTEEIMQRDMEIRALRWQLEQSEAMRHELERRNWRQEMRFNRLLQETKKLLEMVKA